MKKGFFSCKWWHFKKKMIFCFCFLFPFFNIKMRLYLFYTLYIGYFALKPKNNLTILIMTFWKSPNVNMKLKKNIDMTRQLPKYIVNGCVVYDSKVHVSEILLHVNSDIYGKNGCFAFSSLFVESRRQFLEVFCFLSSLTANHGRKVSSSWQSYHSLKLKMERDKQTTNNVNGCIYLSRSNAGKNSTEIFPNDI